MMDSSAPVAYLDDPYAILHDSTHLGSKLSNLLAVIKPRLPWVGRIAVASYDAETDMVKTYLSSDGAEALIRRYQCRLGETESLRSVAEARQPRLVEDLGVFDGSEPAETLQSEGFHASYTLPVFRQGRLLGFVFFNSRERQAPDGAALGLLNMLGHLVVLTVAAELSQFITLKASVRTATAFVRSRDFETGAHLERMAHYARLIALGVAEEYGLDDSTIEHIFLFAPLHDIGKIAIADYILLKPGKLLPEEFEEMKMHTTKGGDIIEAMLSNLGFLDLPDGRILRNIALYHHETLNGSGYPSGLIGEAIPVEARVGRGGK